MLGSSSQIFEVLLTDKWRSSSMSTGSLQKCAMTIHRFISPSPTSTNLGCTDARRSYHLYPYDRQDNKEADNKGSLAGQKENCYASKTQVQTLSVTGVPESAVMQLSGHKCVQSLNHYKRLSPEQDQVKIFCFVASLQPAPNPIMLPVAIVSQNQTSPPIVASTVQ